MVQEKRRPLENWPQSCQGASVVVGACDLFRAAAVDQFQVWCDRAGATMIRPKKEVILQVLGMTLFRRPVNMKADCRHSWTIAHERKFNG